VIRFEYKVIGLSELERLRKTIPGAEKWSFLQAFNHFGEQGWSYCGLYNQTSISSNFLFMREIQEDEK
jgi:hypothetical protein